MTATLASAPAAERIPLGVITARDLVAADPWTDERWTVVGAVAGPAADPGARPRTLRSAPDGSQYLWTGLELRLTPSEVDAYYYNLAGSSPRLYVYCQRDDEGGLIPVAVTLDYIEAIAHSEFGNEVFPVPIPPEIYRLIERYVVANYVPEEPRSRRKPGERADEEGGRGGGCG